MALLGELLLSTPAEAADVFRVVRAADIPNEELRGFFTATQDCLERFGAIDVVLVLDELVARNGRPHSELHSLTARVLEGAVRTPHLKHHAKVVSINAAKTRQRMAEAVLSTTEDEPGREALRRDIREAEERIAQVWKWEDAANAEARPASEWDLAVVKSQPLPPKPDELIERLITRPSVNIAFGPPSSGKSWATMQSVLDAALGGGPFMGNPDIRCMPRRNDVGEPEERVLWVFGSEDTELRIRTRLMILLDAMSRMDVAIPEGLFVFTTPPNGVTLGSADGWEWLDEVLARRKPTILVLDTVASLTGETLDPSKAEQVVPFMRRLHGLRDSLGIVIFALHHTRKESQDNKRGHVAKADSMLGSQAWRSMADAVLMLDAKDGDTSDVSVRLVKSKDIDEPAPAFHAGLQNGLFRFLHWADEEAPPKPAIAQGKRSKVQAGDILYLLSGHPEGLPWNEMHSVRGASFSRAAWYAHRGRVLEEVAGKAFLDGATLRASP